MAFLITEGRAPLVPPTVGCSPVLAEINVGLNSTPEEEIWYTVI
jgi:hypothetical protein